jgi:hypothetical protein
MFYSITGMNHIYNNQNEKSLKFTQIKLNKLAKVKGESSCQKKSCKVTLESTKWETNAKI